MTNSATSSPIQEEGNGMYNISHHSSFNSLHTPDAQSTITAPEIAGLSHGSSSPQSRYITILN